jgi:hypothetical protein
MLDNRIFSSINFLFDNISELNRDFTQVKITRNHFERVWLLHFKPFPTGCIKEP